MSQILGVTDGIEGAKNCAINIANVKHNEKVLVITDAMSDFRISQALVAVCRGVGAGVTTIIMKARAFLAEEPPKIVAEALKNADVVFTPLYFPLGIASSNAAKVARANGVRFIPMTGYSIDTLSSDGACFPPEIIFEIAKRVLQKWRNGRKIHVTCEKGTDLRAEILKPEYVTGGPTRPMQPRDFFGGFAGGYGVVHLWPGWTTKGVVYFDCVDTLKGRLMTPLKYTVEEGHVVKFEGNREQVEFYEVIAKKYKNGDHFGEFGLGINPKARINVDYPLKWEAERHAGCLHCGIGRSAGGHVISGIHHDSLIIKPTIKIDDEIIVENGKLKILEDAFIQELMYKKGIEL